MAIPMLLVFALVTIGFVYAHWSETLYINTIVNTGELDWEFSAWYCWDQGVDYHCRDGFVGSPPFWLDPDKKDIGSQELIPIDTDSDGDNDTLLFNLYNVYPSYFTSVSLYVHNCGTIPLIIDKVVIKNQTHTVAELRKVPVPVVKVDLNGDGKEDIEILWGNNFGVQLEPCENSPEISFWIHILQDAPEGATLTFTIELVAIQWNMYVPP
jgi:hypothetical protein